MLLRVRCVDDGRELLIEGRRLEWRVQVATIKRLVLEQRRRQSGGHFASTSGRDDADDEGEEDDEALGASFLLFQGRILPDSDMVNLFSLTPTDFFVFVQESESGEAITEKQAPRSDHNRQADPQVRQQLLDMGFTRAQVDVALRHGETELDQLIERTMSGGSEEAPARQSSQRPIERAVDPGLIELQEKALADPFDAIMLLKGHLSSDELAALIENPASTIQTLRRVTTRPVTQPSTLDHDNPLLSASKDAAGDDEESKHNDDVADDPSDPIERLTAMGFARDLVVAIYESCGFDEQLAANALLQTLET